MPSSSKAWRCSGSAASRVGGLRRQEVAQLSGVSADYIVQLEQGRATSPSTQVLAALARALRLSNFERDHLLRLGGYTPPAEHAPTLSAAVRRLVENDHVLAIVNTASSDSTTSALSIAER